MTKEEMKNKISMALKDPILQQGFEIICKENAELEAANKKISNECHRLVDSLEKKQKYVAEFIKLRNKVFIARGLLEQWHNQYSDKTYTETFYDALVKATEDFLWSNVQK